MQEGEPQIHFSGRVPGAGRLAVKSMFVGWLSNEASGEGIRLSTADAADIDGNAAETMGKERKVLRFILDLSWAILSARSERS
jgi:hypothetical protein